MILKTITKSLALAAACTSLTATAGVAPAPAPPAPAPATDFWTGSVTLGWDSDYIFRGLHVTDDLFTATLDLNFALNDRWTLNLNAWYANAVEENNPYDELDLYAKLLYKVNDQFSFGPSFRYYTYPFDNSFEDQYEPGVEAVWSPCPNSTVNLGLFYETQTEAFYAELGASYTWKVNDMVSFVPGAVISYLNRDDASYDTEGTRVSGYDISDFNHFAVYLKAPITLKKNVILTPYIAWNIPLDAIDDAGGLNDGQDDEFYGGASLSVGF
jgi:hypothetical protein